MWLTVTSWRITGLWWRSDRPTLLARAKRGQEDNIKTYLGEGKQRGTACTGFIWLTTGYKWRFL